MRRQLIGLITFVAVMAVAAVPALAQRTLQGDRNVNPRSGSELPASLVPTSDLRKHGGPVIYTARGTWQADCPDRFPIRNFEGSTLGPGDVAACFWPHTWDLGSFPCYNPNEVSAQHIDLVINAIAGGGNPAPLGGAQALVIATTGFAGAPSTVHGANFFTDGVEYDFPCDATTCVGFDIVALFGAAGFIDVDLFDQAGGLVDSSQVFATSAGAFYGAVNAGGGIGAVHFNGTGDPNTISDQGDNLEFDGRAGGGDPAPECGGGGPGGGDCTGIAEIEAKLDVNLDVAVSSRASQESVDMIEGKLDTIDNCDLIPLLLPLLGLDELPPGHPCE
jgi:hypothetical protein